MITIIITSYKEPRATLRAVKVFLNQEIKEELKVIVVDPFENTEKFLKKNIKDNRFEFILDPGEGKPFAMNMVFETLFSENKKDIIIFTDGDVYVSDNSLKEIINVFKDSRV